ncbi:MAG: S8 family serine peptidase, partial [Streptosporangiaceae bacterium]
AAPSAIGPQPCAAATDSLANTANIVAGVYGMNLLYLLRDFARGAKIGVLELEPNLRSDISAYGKCYGVSAKVSYTKVDGGSGSGAGSGEAALDIEMLAGLAPQASIDVYQSPNTNAGFYDIFKKFAVSDTNRVLSLSWGSCEANTALASMKAQELLFQQANAQGQTIFAAAGDEGSTSCFRPSSGQTNPKVSALSPASAPFVIGVGGTSFRGTSFRGTGASQQEIVWNDASRAPGTGAGGGGVSSVWCMPGYQHQTKIPGIISAHSRKDSKSCASRHFRESPDVAATVHGAGLLPIGSADEARIMSGSKVLATVAACTTTVCKVTRPAEKAGTVDIRIFADSLWLSARSKGDRFTYKSG